MHILHAYIYVINHNMSWLQLYHVLDMKMANDVYYIISLNSFFAS